MGKNLEYPVIQGNPGNCGKKGHCKNTKGKLEIRENKTLKTFGGNRKFDKNEALAKFMGNRKFIKTRQWKIQKKPYIRKNLILGEFA